MTVAELMERLAEFPGNMPVVVSRYSEYGEADTVTAIEVFDNGGYYSTAYRDVDQLRVRTVVEVS